MAPALTQSVIQMSTHAVFRKTEDGGLLVSSATGECLSLNESAVVLWLALSSGAQTISMLAETLAKEFEVSDSHALAAASLWVVEMRGKGFLS